MKRSAWPSAVEGTLQAPPSKSMAQRAVALASMANGCSVVAGAGQAADVLAAIGVCRTLGAEIRQEEDRLVIRGGLGKPSGELFCGESGLGIRIFTPLAATLDAETTLTATGSLSMRPMHHLAEALEAVGVQCQTTGGFPPIRVKGPMRGGTAEMDGSFSSQILSGLLMAAPYAQHDTHIRIRGLVSRPYVDMSMEIMRHFGVEVVRGKGPDDGGEAPKGKHADAYLDFFVRAGQSYQPCFYQVEGDWSGAAPILVAGAVAGRVRVEALRMDSLQADRQILDALRLAGASVVTGQGWVEVAQPATSSGSPDRPMKPSLQAFVFDATHCPDLFPPLTALAARCAGVSRISGTHRLAAKESHRTNSLLDLFGRLGIRIWEEGDVLCVEGGQPHAATVSAHSDHRIAMAAAIAALSASGPVNIEGAECVSKSYPLFFDDLDKIRK